MKAIARCANDMDSVSRSIISGLLWISAIKRSVRVRQGALKNASALTTLQTGTHHFLKEAEMYRSLLNL